MRLVKLFTLLSIFFFFTFSALGQSNQLSAELQLSNPSDAIDDVIAAVIVKDGEAPFQFYWNKKDISIYENYVEGLSEGDRIEVTVVDARQDTITLTGRVKAKSASEHINTIMRPAVAGMKTILFANIWSNSIHLDRCELTSPFQANREQSDYVLKSWLVEDGEKVKHLQPVAQLYDGEKEFSLLARGEGYFYYGKDTTGSVIHEGSNLFYKNENGEIAQQVVGTQTYFTPQPSFNPNLSEKREGIPMIVAWLVLGALFFTIRMRGIQWKGFQHAFRLVRGDFDDSDGKKEGEVTHFQALATALSATIGLGNIAGVAIAISMGGPGASFWIILAGILGMATKFVEATLGVKYRITGENGEISGGPMYYLSRGLAKRGTIMKHLGKILAVMFAVFCVIGSFGIGNMFQANQAFNQLSSIPGWEGFSEYAVYFGVFIAVLVGLVIVGGIRSIAKVADKIVPLMVTIYVLSCLVILGMNFTHLGEGFTAIFHGAFNPDAMYGGFIGVLIIGFQRAAFSNEAGIGSSPTAHAAAKTDEPISEGTVALLEPFIDTVVVCTMTALVIVFSGYAANPGGYEGSALTTAAFASSLGDWAIYLLSIAVLLFAFSTMISWSYYGLKAFTYLFGNTKLAGIVYKVAFLVFIVIGTSVGLDAVMDFSDLLILSMAFPNILGLVIMSGEVRQDMKDYFKRIQSGKVKKFK